MTSSRLWLLVALVLATLLALALRLYNLAGQSLWLDEGSTWQFVQMGWGALLLELFHPTSAYPLYHLLLKGWVALAGDSEYALRFPSALAGAGAVLATFAAARELGQGAEATRANDWRMPAVASLLLAVSPFAIWYGQEAKVYSLLLLAAALLLWATLRATRLGSMRSWLLVAAIALVAVFVHRLALLLALASFAVWILTQSSRNAETQRRRDAENAVRSTQFAARNSNVASRFSVLGSRFWLLWLLWLGLAAGVVWGMVRGLGSESALTGAAIPADPLTALWLTFVRFSVDRGPGDAPWWWLLPWAALAIWGLIRLIADCRLQIADYRTQTQRRRDAETQGAILPDTRHSSLVTQPALSLSKGHSSLVLLCFLLIPLALFLLQLAYTRRFESRYMLMLLPVWLLVLALPFADRGREIGDRTRSAKDAKDAKAGGRRQFAVRSTQWKWFAVLLLASALTTSGLSLVQPKLGLFSGTAVKEQYREAIGELARRVHPDDLVVIHPSYLRPLYDYYMERFNSDPAPQPVTFGNFKQGAAQFGQREWDTQRQEKFRGFTRSFLLIAPEHARTVDIPKPDDEYGLVGLYFQFSADQQKWPCGIWRFNGAHLLCQESPEAYYTGAVQRPTTPSDAVFGGNIQLLGYTLKATMPEGPGVYRTGGNLPITLFYAVNQQPTESYSIFLHLCRECSGPPDASDDGPPLAGYLQTNVWKPGHPARDDRAIPLPRDLPPGRYQLLLGIYPPGAASPDERLRVTGSNAVENNRVLLGTVEIVEAIDD